MTINQIMDLQYRKLLTAREEIWANIEEVWQAEEDEAIGLHAIASIILVDMDRMDLPEVEGEDKAFLEILYNAMLENDDLGIGTVIPYEARMEISRILSSYRIPDEWNREIALRVVDLANSVMPFLFIGKEHLAEVL